MDILYERLEEVAKNQKIGKLRLNFENLHNGYTENIGDGSKYIKSTDDAVCYAFYRMPSTTAVIKKCLSYIPENDTPYSILDLGSGTGASVFAASSQENINISKMTCVENSSYMIEVFNKLTEEDFPFPVEVIKENILSISKNYIADIVLASFAINELNKKDRLAFLDKMWQMSNKYILIIEPGTPAAHKEMMGYKKHFIEKGGVVVAPCKCNNCPIENTSDWCHFQVRLNRSSIESKIKQSSRNFEDEKFTFLLISKENAIQSGNLNEGILIRRPVINKGNISLVFCKKEGIERKIYSKKDGETYKKAKKLEVGDYF